MIRILVADDHTIVRESLVAVLNASGECRVVGEAADGASAVEQALALCPDVVLVDVSMPRLNGIEVVRRLAQELPQARTLVLTMHEEEEYVLHMVRAGASGYLAKHAATSELIAAIKAVAAGNVHFGPYAAKILAGQVQRPDHALDDPYGALSPREREAFHLIVDGLTTKEVARKLGISVKTAENHRSRILDKLGVRNTAELVRYAARKRLLH
ncbi:response regulator transcription factor [Dokdonella soli]|uniref:Response regulator transcription factor n=1 Tax=Dokdonella soli TaxID=529810 RepID=A0ABN1IH30_9GAMM